jgi:hypothetical protein
MREHIVFKQPFPIDFSKQIKRPTPAAFKPVVSESRIEVLPLVKVTPLLGKVFQRWKDGWITYTDGFENNPDIEIFCGGENVKQASAAACWRQGDLLHFAFEQSPVEMNEVGRKLLLNCIAYISRFTEDRPIAVTPSVFSGAVAHPRSYLDRYLVEKSALDAISHMFSVENYNKLKRLGKEGVRRWAIENRQYIHPGAKLKFEIDTDAKSLEIPIDRVEFFSKTIKALGRVGDAEKALRLLRRYGPAETQSLESVQEWKEWFDVNASFLFFSDQGDYRWYIDPLAKKRGIPSSQLRGSARASE